MQNPGFDPHDTEWIPLMLRHALTVFFCMCCQILAAQPLAIGQTVGDFEVTDLKQARLFRLSEHRGNVVIVNFWATWCAPCLAEMPAIEAYYQQHRSEGLEVVSISMDASKDLPGVMTRARPFSFITTHVSQAKLKAFGRVWRLPSTFVIDRQGVLRKNGHEGEPEVSAELLDKLVTPLLRSP